MKNYKNYLLESLKKETLGDRLRKAYEDDNKELIAKLIGYDPENDFEYKLEFIESWDYFDGKMKKYLKEIEMYCDSDDFDDYANIQSIYIGSYTDMRTYGYEYILNVDEMNYQFTGENLELLKKIYTILDFKFIEDEYTNFFNIDNNIFSNFTQNLKIYVENGIQNSKEKETNEYFRKFLDAGFEVDVVNIKTYLTKITIVIDELPDVKSFKDILDKYTDEFNDFEELTYSTSMNNKEYEKTQVELKNELTKFINKLKPYIGSDGIINYNFFKNYILNELTKNHLDLYYFKSLGGKIYNEYIKNDEWQDDFIDKKLDNYNYLIKNEIITDNMKKKYAYLVAAKKFKI